MESRDQNEAGTPAPVGGLSPQFAALLESAARFQELVPGAVMVGGSAAAIFARHRLSTDHDHVLVDLAGRYEAVLEALEDDPAWVPSPRSRPPLTILGSHDGFEAGLRQLRRSRPLDTEQVTLPSGATLIVPTFAETLRVKGYLVVRRNRMRDYLDVAALADAMGAGRAARVLAGMDEYYTERTASGDAVSTALAEMLAVARPRDHKATADLAHYKELDEKWQDWRDVQAACRELAKEMVRCPATGGIDPAGGRG